VPQAFLQFFRRKNRAWVNSGVNNSAILPYRAWRCPSGSPISPNTSPADAAFTTMHLRPTCAAHGSSTVVEALRLLEQHAASPDQADRDGLKHAVQDGVERTLPRRLP